MHIHLVSDEKFINYAVEKFELYYPGQNIFFVDVPTSHDDGSPVLKHVTVDHKIVIPINFNDVSCSSLILKIVNYQISSVFIHGLSPLKAYISLELAKSAEFKSFWVFFGADLYGWLFRIGKYSIYDDNPRWERLKLTMSFLIKNVPKSIKYRTNFLTVVNRYTSQLDYFCFWNRYDYELFRKHIKTKAQFVFFGYFSAKITENLPVFKPEQKKVVLLNQSASKSGNHLNMLKLIRKLDVNKSLQKLCVPISYGNSHVRKKVLDYGRSYLNHCFYPLLDFMDIDEYFEFLGTVLVAIFGHRRQEAAGNVMYLLAAGAKVFLRSDNNLLQFLRDYGFHVFEIERDLRSMDDLCYIGAERHAINRKLALQYYSQSNIELAYKSLPLN